MENFAGSIRIKNPKTLRKWFRKGWFQEEIDKGYKFYPGCGRFRADKCTCHKCRNINRISLKEILLENDIDIKYLEND